MKRAGRVVTRENLIEAVWGFDSEVRSNTLDAFIRLLRDKVDTGGREEADPDGAGRGLLLAGGGSMRDVASWSIGARLTLWYSLVLLAGLALFGAGIWIVVTHSLSAAIDETAGGAGQRRGDGNSERLQSIEAATISRKNCREYAEATPEGNLIEVCGLAGRGAGRRQCGGRNRERAVITGRSRPRPRC